MAETQSHLGMTDDGWREDAMDRAAALYHPALKPLARVLASTHRYAVDYLEQCPALLVYAAWGFKKPKRREYMVIANRFGGSIRRGVKLKDMIREFGGVYLARKLKGSVCHPTYWPTIMRLRELPPAELGNMIPEKAGEQLSWLRALRTARAYAERFWMGRGPAFWEWSRVAISKAVASGDKNPDRHLREIADFVFRGQNDPHPDWTLSSAMAAAARWHQELLVRQEADRFFKQHKMTLADKVDYGHLPDCIAIGEFEFVALRSGEDLFLEGFAMRHCVASYTTDVVSGGSRIYSVRQHGCRIATVELAPTGMLRALYSDALKKAMLAPLRKGGKALSPVSVQKVPIYRIEQAKGHCNAPVPKPVRHAIEKFLAVVNGKEEAPPQPKADPLAELKRIAGVAHG